ncbi:MAG: Ig-like domain-containing protein [Actinomycetota bacterium]
MRLIGGSVSPDPVAEDDHLAVFVGSADSYHARRTPVAGRYERWGTELRFVPAFGFVAGQDYVVRVRGAAGSHRLTALRLRSEVSAPPAVVTAVYPSGDVVPENVLRFYVHFSVPMTPHLASQFVTLRTASGVADHATFMRFKQELWSADRTRLTVLVDPGRIKRGVATNLDLGPAFTEGDQYVLAVDGGWPSADGSSQLQAFSTRIRAGAPLREQPDVRRWRWWPPRPGTRTMLEISFDRPFDRHSLNGAIHMTASDGTVIAGTPTVPSSETSWSFTPDEPWPAGEVYVSVSDALEDVAGNSLRELLDQPPGSSTSSTAR